MQIRGLVTFNDELTPLYNEVSKDNLPESQQVVAFMIDGWITQDCEEIRYALIKNRIQKMITKSVAKLMAACDLGKHWEQLADSLPLFGLDDNGELCLIKNGLYPSTKGWAVMIDPREVKHENQRND